MNKMATCTLSIEVTDEQKEAVIMFIRSINWDLNITEEQETNNVPVSKISSGATGTDENSYPMPRHEDGYTECPFCFCAPCLINEKNKQQWWPDHNHTPKKTNPSKRKPYYEHFWAMMYNCGAWTDPRYLDKKQCARHGDLTWHRRELMPECIVNKCREWFPN